MIWRMRTVKGITFGLLTFGTAFPSPPWRLDFSLLDPEDSFPLHFNFRFNPDSRPCLTHHWQFAALSPFKKRSQQRDSVCCRWGLADSPYENVVMSFSVWIGTFCVEMSMIFFLFVTHFFLLGCVFLCKYSHNGSCQMIPLRLLWLARSTKNAANNNMTMTKVCAQILILTSKTGNALFYWLEKPQWKENTFSRQFDLKCWLINCVSASPNRSSDVI